MAKFEDDGRIRFLPRSIDDTRFETEDEADVAGYICPVLGNGPDFAFDSRVDGYPENWLEGLVGVELLGPTARSARRSLM